MAELALWAPERSRVRLDGGRDIDRTRGEDGWWRATAPVTDYAFPLYRALVALRRRRRDLTDPPSPCLDLPGESAAIGAF